MAELLSPLAAAIALTPGLAARPMAEHVDDGRGVAGSARSAARPATSSGRAGSTARLPRRHVPVHASRSEVHTDGHGLRPIGAFVKSV
jgi:hypothetical protein